MTIKTGLVVVSDGNRSVVHIVGKRLKIVFEMKTKNYDDDFISFYMHVILHI